MTLQIIEWEKYYCFRMAFSCYFISNKDQVHPCVFVCEDKLHIFRQYISVASKQKEIPFLQNHPITHYF